MAVPQIGPYAAVTRLDSQDEPLDRRHKRIANRALDDLQNGRVNWVLAVTLATGASSTTVAADSITATCQVSLDALTPEAAALRGKVWVTAAGRQPGSPSAPTQTGRLTFNHPVLNSGVVATFRCSVKG
jgi:hypothetical protein